MDNSAAVGRISNIDESTYKAEVERLVNWFWENNLCLSMKIQEICGAPQEAQTQTPKSVHERIRVRLTRENLIFSFAKKED